MTAFNHRDGQIIEVDGARLYCETQDNPDGFPLLMLHGGFGNIEDFNPLLDGLAGAFRLIGLDSRGHGASTLGSAPLTYRRLQQDVEAVIAGLELEQVALLGHSDGGIVALRLGAARAPAVTRIVAIGSHVELLDHDPVRDLYAGLTPEICRTLFPESLAAYLAYNPAPDVEALATALTTLWLDTTPDGYPGDSVRDISCPLLAIRGDSDTLFTRPHALALVERVADACFMNIPFAGHSTHEDQPDIVLWALNRFLRTVGEPAAR